jgi:putative ABC transport system permease protein
MILAFRLARRELRGGLKGLRIVLACLALGVAAIAAVGTLRAGVEQGLARDGARILGGDVEIQGGAQPLPDTLRRFVEARGARHSDIVTLRSMLIVPGVKPVAGGASVDRLLVELKAVDGAWPLFGAATFDPPQSVATALAAEGVAVDQLVKDRLGLQPGASVRLGDTTLRVSAVLTDEPDRVATPSFLGPRALISIATLEKADLLKPGAIVDYRLRVALPQGADPGRFIEAVRDAFPNTGWRFRDSRDAAPGVVQFVDSTSLFMTLVGLTSLLVGGIGVANGVRAWLEARARGIAVLRCLGASPRLVFAVCLIQVGTLALLGIALGVAAGAALPVLGSGLLNAVLPVPLVTGVFPAPLALAALYGLLTAAAFALWPLSRAMRIPGGALFRDALLPARVTLTGPLLWATLVLGAALVALTVATSPDRLFALGFCAASIGTLALFRAGGSLLMRLARHAPDFGRPWARLGFGNLHRPGTATPLMLVSLGLGLSTLAAVALIEGNITRQITEQLPGEAPSFFFIDIQNEQLARFKQILADTPGVRDLKEVPSLRARMVAVNGVPADDVKATPNTVWALRGDRGLTYAAAEPEGTRLVEGTWWPADYHGPPLVSFDANLARGWGVKIGDVMRVNVLGRDIDLHVANLRDVAWRTLGLNFTLIASPGLLEHAPHMHIATVRADPGAQAGLLRAVTDALPNVSGIRVADVLNSVAELLGKLGAALGATGSLTLASGALVLAGAVASGQRRRIQEAVILKSLGATRRQIRAAWLVEFGALGLASGLIAALVGTAASYAVVSGVMHGEWSFLPATLATTIIACVALMLGFGYAGTAMALRAKAAPLLRND